MSGAKALNRKLEISDRIMVSNADEPPFDGIRVIANSPVSEFSSEILLFLYSNLQGSSNGHSPVLNLSKSGGLDQGSTGDQSDHSAAHSPAPSIHDEEDNLSDDNVSDVDERDEKEDGKLFCCFILFLEIHKTQTFPTQTHCVFIIALHSFIYIYCSC